MNARLDAQLRAPASIISTVQRPLSPAEAKAWRGLLHAHESIVRDLDQRLRAAHGLPLSWYDVLCEVASEPTDGIRMGELADRVMLTRAGVSGLVDRLERATLVERRPCKGDARGTYAVATPEGLQLHRRAERTHRDAVRRRYTDHLDDADLALVGSVWDRIAAGSPAS